MYAREQIKLKRACFSMFLKMNSIAAVGSGLNNRIRRAADFTQWLASSSTMGFPEASSLVDAVIGLILILSADKRGHDCLLEHF